MSSVFVSYASDDRECAKEFVRALEGAGISCWIASRDVPAGRDFSEEICKQIDDASYMVVLFSSHAAASPHVASEVGVAFGSGKTIVPVRLDDEPVAGRWLYHFVNSQWIDARSAGGVRAAALDVAKQVAQSGAPGAKSKATVDKHETQGRERQEIDVGEVPWAEARAAMRLRLLDYQIDQRSQEVAQFERDIAALASQEVTQGERIKSLQAELTSAHFLHSSAIVTREHKDKLRVSACKDLERRREEREVVGDDAKLLQSTFEHCRHKASEIARELFFTGRAPRYLRNETARVVGDLPQPPYEAARVFGFLGVAYGLASARQYWDSLAALKGLGPLDQFNRAMSLMYTSGGAGRLTEVVGELVAIRTLLQITGGSDDSITACINVDLDPSGTRPFHVGVWLAESDNLSLPEASRGAVPLIDRVDRAMHALRLAAEKGVSVSSIDPPLLAEAPIESTSPSDSLDLHLKITADRHSGPLKHLSRTRPRKDA
jgi:hypothetical protein